MSDATPPSVSGTGIGRVTHAGAHPAPSLGATADNGRLSPTYSFRRESADSETHPLARLSSSDPRSSSTQSLITSSHESDTRRKLLVVYIHGFYGNAQSFRSFPAHVHSLLRNLLADTHVIHSKIYPRYKTYHALEVARDQFSAWLEPHEAPNTDVILVGHSMGGLLAAEVVLMPNRNPHRRQPFKHRILGTISLDSPFLGLHPGIVTTGIASLFQPSPQPQGNGQSTPTFAVSPPASIGGSPPPTHTQLEAQLSPMPPPCNHNEADPYFDPPFWNDQPFREQSFLNRVMHFAQKHKSEGIINAAINHVVSHLEYGGCLADYSELIARYNKIRALEDVDEVQAITRGQLPGSCARVRFVNYYTLSSGRAKAPKASSSEGHHRSSSSSGSLSEGACATPRLSEDQSTLVPTGRHASPPLLLASDDKRKNSFSSSISTPKISIDAPRDQDTKEEPASLISDTEHGLPANGEDGCTGGELASVDERLLKLSMQSIEARPMEGEEQGAAVKKDIELDLPPLPAEPVKPKTPNLENFTDKDARKLAEKDAKRAQKAYDQAVKDRAKAVRDREKLIEKRRKEAQKEAERRRKEAQKAEQRLAKEQEEAAKRSTAALTSNDEALKSQNVENSSVSQKEPKQRKRRKFCALPRKVNGVRDQTWIDVYMDGMDEVTAHCGLFFPGPHYDRLVGDVGSRIVSWVFDDMSTRAIKEGMD